MPLLLHSLEPWHWAVAGFPIAVVALIGGSFVGFGYARGRWVHEH